MTSIQSGDNPATLKEDVRVDWSIFSRTVGGIAVRVNETHNQMTFIQISKISFSRHGGYLEGYPRIEHYPPYSTTVSRIVHAILNRMEAQD